MVAAVDVSLPADFRLPQLVESDPEAFRQLGRFGTEAPADFVNFTFFGVSLDEDGNPRADVRPDTGDGVDFLLRPEDVRRSALRLVSIEPDKEALLALPEVFELVLEFSDALAATRSFIELDASIRPDPLSGDIFDDFDVSDDGRTISFHDIELEPEVSHRFTVSHARGESGDELVEPINFTLRTAGEGLEKLVFGSVAGSIVLEGAELHEASVFLYDPEDSSLEAVGGAVADVEGGYLVEGVIAGEYGAYAEVSTVDGRDLFLIFDQDGDGVADIIEVSDPVEDVDFSFVLEVVVEVPEGELGKLTFDTELDLADETAVDDFKTRFVFDLAVALRIDPARIFILGIEEGLSLIHISEPTRPY